MIILLIAILILIFWIFFCSLFKSTIIKEILLYPVIILGFEIIMIFSGEILFREFYRSNSFSFLIGASLLGMVLYCFTMKKIDSTINKIDIYIYVYTLFQVQIFITTMGMVEKYSIVYFSSYIVFYLINIYCFYHFRRDKLLKIIIMPSLVSVLILFAFGLVLMILSMISG